MSTPDTFHSVKTDLGTAFGEVLRRLRYERKLSQEQLAADSNLDRTFISHLETGRKQPTLLTIFRLADALALSPSAMIEKVEKRVEHNSSSKTTADLDLSYPR